MSLGNRWAGGIFGTNTGNVALALATDERPITGTLRFMDEKFGLVVYGVKAEFDGVALKLEGEPTQASPDVEVGKLKAVGYLTPEGHIRGDWETSLGTGGNFVLFPHDRTAVSAASAPQSLATRLHTANRTLGVLRLYAEDLAELIAHMKQDFSQGKVIVTYRAPNANEVSLFADDFLAERPKIERLGYLRLGIQEQELGANFQKIVNVELDHAGENTIRAQGSQESWVLGTAERLAAHLRSHEKWLITGVRRWGLNFNGILLFAAIAGLPELTLWRRFAFLAIVAAIIVAVAQLHARYIPNALVYLSAKRPNFLRRASPQIASLFMAVLSGFAASVAYGLLKGELVLPRWMAALLH